MRGLRGRKSEMWSALEPALHWSWWTAERLSAAAKVGLLTTAVVTAFLALQTIKQTQKIEMRANRPMMTAEIVPPAGTYGDVGLRIVNRGRTVAHNVQVLFEPPLPDPDLARLNENARAHFFRTRVEAVRAIFSDVTYPTWPPGMEVTVRYWVPPKDFDPFNKLGISAEGIPPQQAVRIRYEGEGSRSVRYVEDFVLDIRAVIGAEFRSSEAK